MDKVMSRIVNPPTIIDSCRNLIIVHFLLWLPFIILLWLIASDVDIDIPLEVVNFINIFYPLVFLILCISFSIASTRKVRLIGGTARQAGVLSGMFSSSLVLASGYLGLFFNIIYGIEGMVEPFLVLLLLSCIAGLLFFVLSWLVARFVFSRGSSEKQSWINAIEPDERPDWRNILVPGALNIYASITVLFLLVSYLAISFLALPGVEYNLNEVHRALHDYEVLMNQSHIGLNSDDYTAQLHIENLKARKELGMRYIHASDILYRQSFSTIIYEMLEYSGLFRLDPWFPHPCQNWGSGIDNCGVFYTEDGIDIQHGFGDQGAYYLIPFLHVLLLTAVVYVLASLIQFTASFVRSMGWPYRVSAVLAVLLLYLIYAIYSYQSIIFKLLNFIAGLVLLILGLAKTKNKAFYLGTLIILYLILSSSMVMYSNNMFSDISINIKNHDNKSEYVIAHCIETGTSSQMEIINFGYLGHLDNASIICINPGCQTLCNTACVRSIGHKATSIKGKNPSCVCECNQDLSS